MAMEVRKEKKVMSGMMRPSSLTSLTHLSFFTPSPLQGIEKKMRVRSEKKARKEKKVMSVMVGPSSLTHLTSLASKLPIHTSVVL